MKKIYLFLLMAFGLTTLQAQTYPSSCTPTAQMVNIYRNDVVKTATRRLFQTNSTYKDSIEIPALIKDSIARVLYAIQNMPSNSVKDTIMNLFGFQNFFVTAGSGYYEADSLHIHNNGYSSYPSASYYYAHSPKALDMYVADTTTWVQQWNAGNYTNTNNPGINSLALQYGIILTSYYPIPQLRKIHITTTTNRAINIYSLNAAFNSAIGDPQASHVYNYIGDGNSIELAYQSGGIQITYSNRCNDCPSGCQSGRDWTFFVSQNCTVQYLGAVNYGFPITLSPPYLFTCTRGPVLPVIFGSVTGYLQSGRPALNWKVLTQINVKEYIIERSEEGSQFYTADRVAANTSTTAEYNWKDAQVLNGTAWFRIKAVDADGKSKYSSVMKLSNSKSGGIVLYPNPVQNHQFTIQFATPLSGSATVRLYDFSGKLVWNSNISLTPQTGSRSFVLPSSLPPGTYSVLVQNETVNYRQTLVISQK